MSLNTLTFPEGSQDCVPSWTYRILGCPVVVRPQRVNYTPAQAGNVENCEYSSCLDIPR